MAHVYNAVLNNIFQVKNNNPAYNKEVYCEICKLTVSSMVVLNEHRQGKKHKRALHLLRNKLTDFNCVKCNVNSTNLNEYELHVTSSAHVENAKVMGFLRPPTQETPGTVTNAVTGAPAPIQLQTVQPHELQELIKSQARKPKQTTYTCTSCNIQVSSEISFKAHLSSKRHRKNKHKFHTFPGISKEHVKEKYQNNFVRAGTLESTDKDVIFYCKKCDCKMQTKLQLEVHMSSNWHKENHQSEPDHGPSILRASAPVQQMQYGVHMPQPQQMFNFDSSAYGYGYRNWNAESYIYEAQRQIQEQQQKQSEASTSNLYSFPFYALNNQQQAQPQPDSTIPPGTTNIPLPNEIPPAPVQAPTVVPPIQPPAMGNYDFTGNNFFAQ